jgi:hypothetical protein
VSGKEYKNSPSKVLMKKEAKIILTGAFVIILFGMLSSAVLKQRNALPTASARAEEEGAFACTMDAKVCPDGTFVGRIPPYCQFAACPGSSLTE